jgi:hypothetical protein
LIDATTEGVGKGRVGGRTLAQAVFKKRLSVDFDKKALTGVICHQKRLGDKATSRWLDGGDVDRVVSLEVIGYTVVHDYLSGIYPVEP